jgi:putative ABC transport system substrate-binding protein
MRRRAFIAGLGSAAMWPVMAPGQTTMPAVGFLSSSSQAGEAQFVAAFVLGLKEGGYVGGQNVAIEYRWAEGQYDRLPALAADLVRRGVAVIAAPASVPSVMAAKAATTTIPIVFSAAVDPVTTGLVKSLNRPDGNVTGVTSLNAEVGPKRVELIHEVVSTAKIIALLINPINPNAATLSTDAQTAARSLGLQLLVLQASNEHDLAAIFEKMVQSGAGALVIGPDPFLAGRNKVLAELALRHALPTIFNSREFAVAGGLMSYGSSFVDAYRQLGLYTAKLLNGTKLADLPVMQAVKVELVINLKTAKALGLEIPPTLLARADEVIE